jgi:hypothetical protein
VENAKLTVYARCIKHCTLTRASKLHLKLKYHGTEGLISSFVSLDVKSPRLDNTDVMYLHVGSGWGLVLGEISSDDLSAYGRLGIASLVAKKEEWQSCIVRRDVDLV